MVFIFEVSSTTIKRHIVGIILHFALHGVKMSKRGNLISENLVGNVFTNLFHCISVYIN